MLCFRALPVSHFCPDLKGCRPPRLLEARVTGAFEAFSYTDDHLPDLAANLGTAFVQVPPAGCTLRLRMGADLTLRRSQAQEHKTVPGPSWKIGRRL